MYDMMGINKQLSAHFRTLMTLKLEQAETVVEVVSIDTDNTDKLYEELIYRIHIRNFNYLALCSESRELEMLYGEQIYLADPEPFFNSLEKKKKRLQWAGMNQVTKWFCLVLTRTIL